MLDNPEAALDTDLESGAILLGDHLVEGSDLAGERESSALLASLRGLIRHRAPATALLVGPSSAEFVELLPPETAAHLVVRHLVDARAIASVVTDRPGDELFSGGFELFHGTGPYDLIVLLGGGPEVLSPIAEGMSETEILAKAKDLLAPDGLLLYGAENALGLHDVLAAEAAIPRGDDRLWYQGKSKVSQRPWVHRELVSALDQLGWQQAGCLLGYPSPQTPNLIVNARAAGSTTLPRLSHELPRALTSYFSRRAATRDAAPFVDLVMHADLQVELAPVWYFLLSPQEQDVQLPALTVAEPDTAAEWSMLSVYEADGSCALTWSDGADTTAERSSLEVTRTLSRPTAPDGKNLERVLRSACAGSDHVTLRSLLTRYRTWLETDDAQNAPAPEQRWFATPDNVILTPEGELVLDDPSWSVARSDASAAAFLRGSRVFASRLLAAAAPHPWALPVSPDEVTRTLAAMAGVTATSATIAEVADLEVELGLSIGDLHGDAEELRRANRAAGEKTSHLPQASASGFRELLGQVRSLTYANNAQKRQIAWLEGTLKLRDRRIAEYDRLMFKLEESLSYKVLRSMGAPKRAAVERAKDRVEKAVPPERRDRARRVLKRALGED